MEVELEPRVKPLSYKIKAISRESPSQKALHILDADLRSHWSTGTNTKEWILLELEESCLLSHVRIHNKSVHEWEIAVGLRFKPEAFVKVRPRCEAPRRDMIYPLSYTACRYVRISCLRGNPIAIFYVQLIGVSVPGLEPELQPVVDYLLPHIISNKQNTVDIHLQLLQDMASRLLPFLPHLEVDLSNFSEAAECNIHFFAMLVGPFYPILCVVNERETAKASSCSLDADISRVGQTLTVSSNFEAQPRKSRSPSPYLQSGVSSPVFRLDAMFMLLRKAYKDPHFNIVCRMAARVLQKLSVPVIQMEASALPDKTSSSLDEMAKTQACRDQAYVPNYSALFGDEFKIPDDNWNSCYLNVMDIASVEEGILHVLYACAVQPLLCCKFIDHISDFWISLPLIQALLPALRPSVNSSTVHIDETFWQWNQPFVQCALSQIVATLSSSLYHPLLRACAGYLSSFQPSHVKAACILIDLCSGPLSPWLSNVIAKVDLAIELVEDFLGIIQVVAYSAARSRAVLKYIILALSGYMDDILMMYKDAKGKLLFLVEMLEPFLDPAITPGKKTIAFGGLSTVSMEKQENDCVMALNIIHVAAHRPSVLPSLESEWRRGSAAPSVLLSILAPQMQLPPEIDLCNFQASEGELSNSCSVSSVHPHGSVGKSNIDHFSDGKNDAFELAVRTYIPDDVSLLFAPQELRNMILGNSRIFSEGHASERSRPDFGPSEILLELNEIGGNTQHSQYESSLFLDMSLAVECFNLEIDYLHLMNFNECETRAAEFRHLAINLNSQPELDSESHNAAIDCLLLAAECYVNPFFINASRAARKFYGDPNRNVTKNASQCFMSGKSSLLNDDRFESVSQLERTRDKIVIQILLEAAKLDKDYHKNKISCQENGLFETDEMLHGIEISPSDEQIADAVTLVRNNQVLLYNFFMQQLQKDQQIMREILMQSLSFVLHCATELLWPPENLIDIILEFAEQLNILLTSYYHKLKESSMVLDPEKVYQVQRHWLLLQRLIIESSGGYDGHHFAISVQHGFRHRNLIAATSWIQKASKFSSSLFPLVRFLGWMALSRYAKQFIEDHLPFALDFSQLTCLFFIFGDELALFDQMVNQNDNSDKLQGMNSRESFQIKKSAQPHVVPDESSFCVIYPDLHKFFPNMKKQFESFGKVILEAVCLQMKFLPSYAVPDLLCWFSSFCSCPFYGTEKDTLKGYATKNAKAIVLYVLEAILTEHMEAMLPEISRVSQIVVSLCQSYFCDVAFMKSVLRLLKPLISHALKKGFTEEKLSANYSRPNLESLCFDELLRRIRTDHKVDIIEKNYQKSLVIFVLGAFLPDLSIQKKLQVLDSLSFWADFTAFQPPPSFCDYLFSFLNVMESCLHILAQVLRALGIRGTEQDCVISEILIGTKGNCNMFPLSDVAVLDHSSLGNEVSEMIESSNCQSHESNDVEVHLSMKDVKRLSETLEVLVSKITQTLECCWKLHPRLAGKLTLASSQCYLLTRCLASVTLSFNSGREEDDIVLTSKHFFIHWRSAIVGLGEAVLINERNHHWQVASFMLDYLLSLQQHFVLDDVVPVICSAVKHLCCHAPQISWRLQSSKFISMLLSRDICSLCESVTSLVDLFCTMLDHQEPEQRLVALQYLSQLIGQQTNRSFNVFSMGDKSSTLCSDTSALQQLLPHVVSSTWDKVATLVVSDASLHVRLRSMVLLFGYIPFAKSNHLRMFLESADKILECFVNHLYPMHEGPLTVLSLNLLANVCLYCHSEDIMLIPQKVWTKLEAVALAKDARGIAKVCQALCRLRNEGDEAKEVLKGLMSLSSSSNECSLDFRSTRDSILEVIASLTSIRSHSALFSATKDQKALELEEAEVELSLLLGEKALHEMSASTEYAANIPASSCLLSNYAQLNSNNDRLEQIKSTIRSIERSRLREEIASHRQKKLFQRQARQKYLDSAAFREKELLEELDRERIRLAECEIERQKLLEIERAKTRELQYNLDIEKEKQTQRELQHELELADSGLHAPWREFSASSSRTRERYHERDNTRSGYDGGIRSSSRGREVGTQPTLSSTTCGASNMLPAVPLVGLGGPRSFSSHQPAILQPPDRMDERGGACDDTYDGGRDSGDTGSTGSELVSAFEGSVGGHGSAQRQVTRGSKGRQIIERRERDGRREGKWERKHS